MIDFARTKKTAGARVAMPTDFGWISGGFQET
jgi:hypothetical protein